MRKQCVCVRVQSDKRAHDWPQVFRCIVGATCKGNFVSGFAACSDVCFTNTFPGLVPLTVHKAYMCFLFFMTHTYGTHKDFFFILALSNEPACTFPAEMGLKVLHVILREVWGRHSARAWCSCLQGCAPPPAPLRN